MLYANTVKRGNGIEVIEDIVPVCDAEFALLLAKPPRRVVLCPQGEEIPFAYADGRVCFTLPRFRVHQAVIIE